MMACGDFNYANIWATGTGTGTFNYNTDNLDALKVNPNLDVRTPVPVHFHESITWNEQERLMAVMSSGELCIWPFGHDAKGYPIPPPNVQDEPFRMPSEWYYWLAAAIVASMAIGSAWL